VKRLRTYIVGRAMHFMIDLFYSVPHTLFACISVSVIRIVSLSFSMFSSCIFYICVLFVATSRGSNLYVQT